MTHCGIIGWDVLMERREEPDNCGISGWDVLMERREEPDRRYLDNHLKWTSQAVSALTNSSVIDSSLLFHLSNYSGP